MINSFDSWRQPLWKNGLPVRQSLILDSLKNWENSFYIWGKISAKFDARSSNKNQQKFNTGHNEAQITTKLSVNKAISLTKITSKFEVCTTNGLRVRYIQKWIIIFTHHQILTNTGAFSGLENSSSTSLTDCERYHFSSRTLKIGMRLDHYLNKIFVKNCWNSSTTLGVI